MSQCPAMIARRPQHLDLMELKSLCYMSWTLHSDVYTSLNYMTAFREYLTYNWIYNMFNLQWITINYHSIITPYMQFIHWLLILLQHTIGNVSQYIWCEYVTTPVCWTRMAAHVLPVYTTFLYMYVHVQWQIEYWTWLSYYIQVSTFILTCVTGCFFTYLFFRHNCVNDMDDNITN